MPFRYAFRTARGMESDVGAAMDERDGEGALVGVGTHPVMNAVANRKRDVRMIG